MLDFSPTFSLPILKDIKKLEHEIGSTLPDSYIQFLLSTNGGLVCGCISALNDQEIIYDVDYLFGVDSDDSNVESQYENLRYAYDNEIVTHSFPEKVIKIGSGTMHNTLMSLLEEDYGYIYCGDREEGEEHNYNRKRAYSTSNAEELAIVGYQCVAKNFSEFLDRLYEEDEE